MGNIYNLQYSPHSNMNCDTINIVRLTGKDRQVGDPDFTLSLIKSVALDNFHLGQDEYLHWQINVFPSLLFVREWTKGIGFPSKQRISMGITEQRPLYHLLESNGSPSIAMLYKDYLDNWHPFYNLNDLPMLSPQVLIAHLVHLIIWEEGKLRWVTKSAGPAETKFTKS